MTEYLKLKSSSPNLPENPNFIIRIYGRPPGHLHPSQHVRILLRPLFQIHVLVMMPDRRVIVANIPYNGVKLVPGQHIIAHLQSPVPENILKHLMMSENQFPGDYVGTRNYFPDLPWIHRVYGRSWIQISDFHQFTADLERTVASLRFFFFCFARYEVVVKSFLHGV